MASAQRPARRPTALAGIQPAARRTARRRTTPRRRARSGRKRRHADQPFRGAVGREEVIPVRCHEALHVVHVRVGGVDVGEEEERRRSARRAPRGPGKQDARQAAACARGRGKGPRRPRAAQMQEQQGVVQEAGGHALPSGGDRRRALPRGTSGRASGKARTAGSTRRTAAPRGARKYTARWGNPRRCSGRPSAGWRRSLPRGMPRRAPPPRDSSST